MKIFFDVSTLDSYFVEVVCLNKNIEFIGYVIGEYFGFRIFK